MNTSDQGADLLCQGKDVHLQMNSKTDGSVIREGKSRADIVSE